MIKEEESQRKNQLLHPLTNMLLLSVFALYLAKLKEFQKDLPCSAEVRYVIMLSGSYWFQFPTSMALNNLARPCVLGSLHALMKADFLQLDAGKEDSVSSGRAQDLVSTAHLVVPPGLRNALRCLRQWQICLGSALPADPPCTSIVANSLSNRSVAKSLSIVAAVVKDTPRCCSRAKAEESESQGCTLILLHTTVCQ